ncbi:MAG: hypothetical protein QOI88_1121 [Gammaproteobacteria bacterium]|nr:hypothetical protein [Gammaproteobacteria bacterium]
MWKLCSAGTASRDRSCPTTTLISWPPYIATSDLPELNTHPAPSSHAEGVVANVAPLGKAVYEDACASCHGWSGVSPVIPFATLTGARAVNDPTATNVVQVILSGVYRHAAGDTANMPAFGAAYSDYEIASDHAACVGTLSRIFTVIRGGSGG